MSNFRKLTTAGLLSTLTTTLAFCACLNLAFQATLAADLPLPASQPARTVDPGSVYVPPGYPKDGPRVTIFLNEWLHGESVPLKLPADQAANIELIQDEESFDRNYDLVGNVLQFAVGDKSEARKLVAGRQYEVQLHGFDKALFTVPKVETGTVGTVTVDLQKASPAATQDHGPKLVTVNGVIDDKWFTPFAKEKWILYYTWGNGTRLGNGTRMESFAGVRPDGTFALGRVPLGGELVILREDRTSFLLYANKVDARAVKLPNDTTLKFDAASTISVKLKFDKAKLPNDQTDIGIYRNKDSNAPLALIRTAKFSNEAICDLPPGTYNIRTRGLNSRNEILETTLAESITITKDAPELDLRK